MVHWDDLAWPEGAEEPSDAEMTFERAERPRVIIGIHKSDPASPPPLGAEPKRGLLRACLAWLARHIPWRRRLTPR